MPPDRRLAQWRPQVQCQAMNTQTHLLLASALFARPGRENRLRNAAIICGALLPDAVIFVMFAWSKLIGTPESEVWSNWYAAAPVVAIGAPLGALAASVIPRGITLGIVSILCVVQFVAFCAAERISGWPLAASLIALAMITGGFSLINHWGDRRIRRIQGDRPSG